MLIVAIAVTAANAPVARAQDGRRPEAKPRAAARALPDRLVGGAPVNVEDLRQMEAHTVALAALVLRATVNLGGACGVLVRDRFVLTAGHVSRNYDRGRRAPQVTLHDGRKVAVRFLGRAGGVDAGLAEVREPDGLTYLEMGRSGELRPGAWCLMLGFPSGPKPWRPASIRVGRILEVRNDGSLVTDCSMQSGDSGGPLVDMQGRVIGINSRITGDLATNVHVQIDAFRNRWEKLVAGERDGRRFGTLRSVSSRSGSRNSVAVRRAFRPITDEARRSVVEVLGNGKRVAFGVVVHSRGVVITKASALRGKLTCRLVGRDQPVVAKRLATEERNDLALISLDAKDLVPARWASAATVGAGRWLATLGVDAVPLSWGVVSVPVHERPARPYLGVRMRIRRSAVQIRSVEPDSPASAAGLRADDVVVSLDGESMDRGRTWRRAMARRKPGDRISLVVRRGETTHPLTATLSRSRRAAGRAPRQLKLWGPLSPVRRGFSAVVQHDTVLAPTDCGSPIVDLEGRVVGLNIARASRVETLALPASTVEAAVREMLHQSY